MEDNNIIELSLEDKIRLLVSNKKNSLGEIEKYDFPKMSFLEKRLDSSSDNLNEYGFPSDEMLIQSFDDELIKNKFLIAQKKRLSLNCLDVDYIRNFEENNSLTSSHFLFARFQSSLVQGLASNAKFIAIDANIDKNSQEYALYSKDKNFFKSVNTALCYSKEQYEEYAKNPSIKYLVGNSSLFSEIEFYLKSGVLFACYLGNDFENLIKYLVDRVGKEENPKQKKTISEAQIDLMVNRIFDIFKDSQNHENNFLNLEQNDYSSACLKACQSSIVLLKDEDNLLPLTREKKVAFIGDFFSNKDYGKDVSKNNSESFITGDELVGNFYNINSIGFAHGYLKDDQAENIIFVSAIDAVEKSDIAIIYLRVNGNSISYEDNDLVEKIIDTQKDIILVLDADKFVEIPLYDNVSTVIYVAGGGEKVHSAILGLLNGDYAPSGRLTSPWKVNQYITLPLGFGLSFGKFEYSNLVLDNKVVSFTIKNDSSYEAEAVPQLYVRLEDKKSIFNTPQLKGYTKIKIFPGQSAKVEIPFDEQSLLEYDEGHKCNVIRKGTYVISVGDNEQDCYLEVNHEENSLRKFDNGSEKSIAFENVPDEGQIKDFIFKKEEMRPASKKNFIVSLIVLILVVLAAGFAIFYFGFLNKDTLYFLISAISGGILVLGGLIYFIIALCFYLKRKKKDKKSLDSFLNKSANFKVLSQRDFAVEQVEKEVAPTDEAIIENADKDVEEVEEVELDKDASLSQEEIEVHEEEMKHLIEEKSSNIFENVKIAEEVKFDLKSSLQQIVENLKKIFNGHGLVVELNSIRSLISSFATSHLIVIDTKVSDLLPLFFDSLKDYFGFEYHKTKAEDNWSSSFNLCWEKNEEGSYVITDFITDVYKANKVKNNICFIVIENVDMSNADLYLKEIIDFSSSPKSKNYIKVNKQISIAIPKNMFFIIIPKEEDYMKKMSKKLSSVVTVNHLLMRNDVVVPLNEEISCLSYRYLNTLVDEYKNEFYLSEKNWKNIDSLFNELSKKEPIVLSNKCTLKIENYATAFIASGGDEFQAEEAIGRDILLPYVSTLDYFRKIENYNSFIEVVNNSFGEEAAEILRYYKMKEANEA